MWFFRLEAYKICKLIFDPTSLKNNIAQKQIHWIDGKDHKVE